MREKQGQATSIISTIQSSAVSNSEEEKDEKENNERE